MFSKLKHTKINLMIEFTDDELVKHFDHKLNDETAESMCNICNKLIKLQRHVPELKKLLKDKK
jgi:SMC interacting uncharacterized protein involved in chromosome segregation